MTGLVSGTWMLGSEVAACTVAACCATPGFVALHVASAAIPAKMRTDSTRNTYLLFTA
jgi:hypothetical protein